jgi:1-deoxy-D-xylulose-5-phosphate synthase
MFTIPAQRQLPNIVICSPKDEQELRRLMHTAFSQEHPFALHYPRDAGFDLPAVEPTPIPVGEGELLREGADLLIVAFGPIVMRGLEVAEMLASEDLSVGVINARYAKPLDRDLILHNARGKKLVVTLEESIAAGGFGSAVLEAIAEAALTEESLRGLAVRIIGLPGNRFVDHGAVGDLRRTLLLDVEGIGGQVREAAAAVGLASASASGRSTKKTA